MEKEWRKSINSVLHERMTSPLFGSFALSWLIWNWRIIYLTFFISEYRLGSITRIEYILEHYSDNLHLLWGPILSTIGLILIYPGISSGAYWINLQYKRLKRSIKQKIEKEQLLTIEESIEIRNSLTSSEERFANSMKNKNAEIKRLITENEETKREKSEATVRADGLLEELRTASEATGNLNKEIDKQRDRIKNYELAIETAESRRISLSEQLQEKTNTIFLLRSKIFIEQKEIDITNDDRREYTRFRRKTSHSQHLSLLPQKLY